jgi:tetratricopeptide (TPR) repeat protein
MRQTSPTLIAALLVSALSSSSGIADQNDPRLDKLFIELKNAATIEMARPLEAEIWDIWLRSGNKEVDRLMVIGVTGMNNADYDRALDVFTQIVRLAPDFAEGWNKRATTLYLMDRYEDSIKDIAKVLALEPRHFGALSGLGLCNARLHKDKEALSAFERAAAVDPNMPGVKANIEEIKKRLERESI